jgi:hypothetical protein
VAPGPTLEEDASLQVGLESDWRLACCSCAPVDVITAGPPMVMPTAAWTGRGCPSTARVTVAPCAGRPHPRLLPRRWPHREVVQDVVRHGGGGSGVLGWSCPHSARMGARTSSRVLGQPPPIGAEVVAAAGGAEVVAAAGEAAHCRGGCLRWRDRQCHLLPDLWLFGFNGLVVAPVGRRGRGPFRSGVCAEVIATAGESSVQRWPSPSVLMWSPPLASRSELAIPWPYRCGGSSYLQSRDGTRAPLENRCNTFSFCKVLKSTIY